MQKSKFVTGRFAVCERCGARPCLCPPEDAPPAAIAPDIAPETPGNIKSLTRPISGNALPFAIWDVLIHQHGLSVHESSVLIYLCRRTNGYGHHAGDYISYGQVAAALRISRAASKRAIVRLVACGLVVQSLRREHDRQEFAVSHLRVCIE